MQRDYSTDAVVLGSHKLREADRVVTLFTADRGKVPTVVKGVRKIGSRFGGRLEPFTELKVRLNEGRNLHTLTGADTVRTGAAIRDRPAALKAGLSFIDLLARETNDLERRPRTYNLLVNFLGVLGEAAGSGMTDGGAAGVSGNGEAGRGAALLALGAELKLLLLAGYLPHLSGCSVCGGDDRLPVKFSAREGGALCADCHGDSFPIAPEALATMRRLLEQPLTAAAALETDDRCQRQMWQAIREICRYHLGVDLRVEPW